MVWNDLVKWVKGSHDGSIIHKSLSLRSMNPSSTSTTTTNQRGLFTSDTIHCGDLLIQLPLAASIDGDNMPCTYEMAITSSLNGDNVSTTNSATIKVSPWLRCLASLIKELLLHEERTQSPQQSSHYLASLPLEYDTLLEWSYREIFEYLAGTRPPTDHDFQDDDDEDHTMNVIPCPVCTAATCNHNNRSNVSSQCNQWMIMSHPKQIRQQYEKTIRPYLIHCGIINNTSNDNHEGNNGGNIEEKEYQRCQYACQILSTRSFYSNSCSNIQFDDHKKNTGTSDDENSKYNDDGPYLLPIIDLINHADTCTGITNTKLEFIVQSNSSEENPSQYYFVMRALRTLPPNTEILHSYGDELSNFQFISSFGFIPMNRIMGSCQPQHLHEAPDDAATPSCRPCYTPTTTDSRGIINNSLYSKSVTISKQEIWDNCWDVVRSGFAQDFACTMVQNQAFDPSEVWVVSVEKHRKADCVPDNITIVQPPSISVRMNDSGDVVKDEPSSSILSDELVTTACVPFLPDCAYAEITSRTLLDVSVLQDYFLGHLVTTALLQMIQRRLLLYRPISSITIQRLLPSVLVSDNAMDDKEILRHLLQYIETNSNSCDSRSDDCRINTANDTRLYIERCHFAYGVTIRLEEKKVLNALGSAIEELVNGL